MVDLPPTPMFPEREQGIIDLLTRYLERAKAGELLAVCVVACTPKGAYHGISGAHNRADLVFALETAKTSIVLEGFAEGERDEPI